MVGDRSHLVGICDYDASEAQFVPQKIRNNFGGQIARRLVAYDLRYAQMAHHHKRRARLDAGGEGQKVAAFQFRLGLFQDGRSVVVVRDGAAVAGEVLEAGNDASCLDAAGHDADKRRAKLRVRSKRARADDRRSTRGYVGDRRKVHVKADGVQASGNVLPCLIDSGGVCLLAERLQRRRLDCVHGSIRAHTADGPALFVGAEEERNFCVGFRIAEHFNALRAVFEILCKVNDAADGHCFECFFRRIARARGSLHARQKLRRHVKQLPDLLVFRHGG